jgi:hypothetical protein
MIGMDNRSPRVSSGMLFAGDNRAAVVGAGVSSQNVVSSVPGCDGAVAWANVVPTVSDNDGTVLVTKGT